MSQVKLPTIDPATISGWGGDPRTSGLWRLLAQEDMWPSTGPVRDLLRYWMFTCWELFSLFQFASCDARDGYQCHRLLQVKKFLVDWESGTVHQIPRCPQCPCLLEFTLLCSPVSQWISQHIPQREIKQKEWCVTLELRLWSFCLAPSSPSIRRESSCHVGTLKSPFEKVWASQVVLVVKNLPVSSGDVRDKGSTPGSGRSPGEEHGNLLFWGIPWVETGGLWPTGSQREGHDWSDLAGTRPW